MTMHIERKAQPKMAWHVKALVGILGGFSFYMLSLPAVQLIDNLPIFDEKIKSYEQLKKVVKEESGKLGLDWNKINLIYNGNNNRSMRKDEDVYLEMRAGHATRNNVKHELYHIKRDIHRAKNPDFFEYIFITEPRATTYQLFGWQL